MMNRLCLALLWALSLSNVHATRHSTGNQPEEYNVDAQKTYDADFMKDMASSCRPEHDGYFGSTFGGQARLQYGFRLETKPLSSIEDMLDLVEDKIVDGVLSNSFPDICGFTRRRLFASYREIRATGFRFLKIHEKRKCSPQEGTLNYCAIFTAQVNIFGVQRDAATKDIENFIKTSLNVDGPSIHDSIAKVDAEDSEFRVLDDGFDDDNDGFDTNIIGYICFALAAIIFAGIFYWKCILPRKEQREQRMAEYNSERDIHGERNLMPNFEDEPAGIAYGKPIDIGTYDTPIPVGFSDDGSRFSEDSYYEDRPEPTLI